MKFITCYITEYDLKQISLLIEKGVYPSRSEFIRYAVRNLVREYVVRNLVSESSKYDS